MYSHYNLNSYIYLYKCHNFSKNDLGLQWEMFEMDKTVHWRDILGKEKENKIT